MEVGKVFDEFRIDLAKPEVVFEGAEPLDPGALEVAAELGLLRHEDLNIIR